MNPPEAEFRKPEPEDQKQSESQLPKGEPAAILGYAKKRGAVEFISDQIKGLALPLRRGRLWGNLQVPVLLGLAWSAAGAGVLSDPEVDQFNIRIGTQTFAPRYRFTTNTPLVETAEAVRAMGSDIIKFYLGRNLERQYGISLSGTITNLAALAATEASVRQVLDMPFRHVLLWAYCFSAVGDAGWKDGFPAVERQREYEEIYDLTRWLLTNFNNSGRSFYIGHWEGDWHLLSGYDASVNPSVVAIQGMIAWLNTRQRAVDDALAQTPHTNVRVYHYTEVNRVRDAMLNNPTNNQRLVNSVLPMVTNIDFVSWSSYDGMNLSSNELHRTLDYIEAHLPRNKAAVIPGKRVLIGEYGWGGSLPTAAQENPTRMYIQRLLPWSPRFILFWQMYDNEGRAYCLIDTNRTQTPAFLLHQRFANLARLKTAQFREQHRRLPNDREWAALMTPQLSQLLPAPVPITVSNLDATILENGRAIVRGSVCQGVYGDHQAVVRVFHGPVDGGDCAETWKHCELVGTNASFGPFIFSAAPKDLPADYDGYFRFNATNASAAVWAPKSTPFGLRSKSPMSREAPLRRPSQGLPSAKPQNG